MSRIIFFALLAIILISAGWFFLIRERDIKTVEKEGPVIFFGDSLTAGVGAQPGEDFPSIIAKDLKLDNVVNAGVSGNTTQDALNRLRSGVLDKNPSLVIVFLGGNDFLQQIPIDVTVQNIDNMVDEILKTGSAAILVHIKSNPLNDKFLAPSRDIAKKHNIILVENALDGILGNSDLLSDQVHPNAAGYKVLARRISPSVKKVLGR